MEQMTQLTTSQNTPQFDIDHAVPHRIFPSLRLPVKLAPFESVDCDRWRNAIDLTSPSPSPLSGPEFAATSIRGWEKTYLFDDDNLLIPLHRSQTTHLRLFKSDVFTGVAINSLLGSSSMNAATWDSLSQLPRDCVISLDVPEEYYTGCEKQWRGLGFDPVEECGYHRIELPSTYEEWFSSPLVRRQNIRRAEEAGLTLVFGGRELLSQFYALYLNSYSRWQSRQSASQAHQLVRFERLFDISGSVAKIVGVQSGADLVAAAIICAYRRTAGYLYGGVDFDFQKARPNNLLHAGIIKHLIDSGIKEYNLGMSLNLRELERFKESLGATRHISHTLRRHRFPRLKRIFSLSRNMRITDA
jgi:hypothetical protein